MFSSKKTDWATPQAFYDELNLEYNFTLDPCCSTQTAKCQKYYTEEDDGLSKDWGGETVFMNPPYGRGIDKWIKKAYNEGMKKDTTVVCLIPARTDTKYWHDYCMRAKEIFFVKGRLKFSSSQNSAPFPSAIIVFRAGLAPLMGGNYPKTYTMNKKGEYSYGHLY